MDGYAKVVDKELKKWQKDMIKGDTFTSNLAHKVQLKINNIIPENLHIAITGAIKGMIRAVLFSSEYMSKKLIETGEVSLPERDMMAREKIDHFKKVGAATGAGTGAGGFLLSLAEFPVLLSMKMKMLYDLAGIYGFNLKDYKERLYMLYIFQLTYSSGEKRRQTYQIISNWTDHSRNLPQDIHAFDWRSFQQEYRDYIDLAKLLQMVPGIGAFVGAITNHQLISRLGDFAMNAYRMRIIYPEPGLRAASAS